MLKITGACVCLLLFSLSLSSQSRKVRYDLSLETRLARENQLTFWQRANHHGTLPTGNGGILQGGVFSDFTGKHTIGFSYGLSGVAYVSKGKNTIFPDQVYLSAQWQKIRLDLGMIHPDTAYNGLSSTNGNLVFSDNIRTLPGYNLRTEFIPVPLTGRVLSFKFNWADYLMIDKRYVDKTHLHNKSFYLRIQPWQKLQIIVGLEHWAQWSGTSPQYGKQPSSFRDYVKVFCARSGGIGATVSDSINVLGNHLGREHLRINYHAQHYTLSFYHDIPFEDGSGTRFANFPDGVYGLYYGAQRTKAWIQDVMYEFYYTKSQSGSRHDRPATPEEEARQIKKGNYSGRVILGGNDNYFNNGEYRSGWTYYGQTIGSPFLTPFAPDDNGMTPGIYNNRIVAHYLGMQGYIHRKIPYKLRLSHSSNYGTYSLPFSQVARQFSFSLEAGIWQKAKAPFHVQVGVYGDFGDLFQNNLGISLRFSRQGIF